MRKASLQGNQQQLPFFKNFQNDKKIMKQPKPSDKNTENLYIIDALAYSIHSDYNTT